MGSQRLQTDRPDRHGQPISIGFPGDNTRQVTLFVAITLADPWVPMRDPKLTEELTFAERAHTLRNALLLSDDVD